MKSAFGFRWRSTVGFFLVLAMFLLALPALAQVGYIDATSGFLKEQTFHASAAETTNGSSAIIDAGAYQGGVLTLAVTVVSGTNPTLDVAFQTCSANLAASCVTLQSATQVTAAGTQLIQVNGFGRYIRMTWTIGGTATPTFTFSIYGAFKPDYFQAQTGPGDPCENPAFPKQSVPIAVSSATTAVLVPSFTGKATYVCGITALFTSGTSPTMLLKYGTQTSTACDTGAVNLTGVMNITATAGQGLVIGTGTSLLTAPASNQLCITSAGTTPNYQGFLTYVQQ
jgi:hypothetical protein